MSAEAVEIRRVRGPLDDEGLGWLAVLYGAVDAKYRSLDYLRHQFVANPFGWSAHVFAVAGGRGVGHCGVVPFRARDGSGPFVAGKLEALAVDPEFRGRRAGGRSVASEVLEALYPFGIEAGTEVLFGLAPRAVARIHVRAGCHQAPTDAPAYTFVLDAAAVARGERSRKRRAAIAALARAQATALAAAGLAVRARARLEEPRADDAELVAMRVENGRWSVSGDDAWDWYLGSGLLRVLEVPGRSGCRALLRVQAEGGSTVQLVAWRPRRRGPLPALLLLGCAAAVARSLGAPTLRFQPWAGDGDDGTLARACALAGGVRRAEANLLLYPADPRRDAVQLTPFFYVTF